MTGVRSRDLATNFFDDLVALFFGCHFRLRIRDVIANFFLARIANLVNHFSALFSRTCLGFEPSLIFADGSFAVLDQHVLTDLSFLGLGANFFLDVLVDIFANRKRIFVANLFFDFFAFRFRNFLALRFRFRRRFRRAVDVDVARLVGAFFDDGVVADRLESVVALLDSDGFLKKQRSAFDGNSIKAL